MTQYITPKAAINAAFARIEPGMEMGFWRRGTLQANFETAHRKGGSELDAVVAALAGREWRWPWFDNFVVVFGQLGFWPKTWEELEIAPPPPWERMSDLSKCGLLTHTLLFAVHMAQDCGGMGTMARTTGVKLTPTPGNPDCPAEAHFAKLNKRIVERGNYSKPPPWFPGDTTRLLVRK